MYHSSTAGGRKTTYWNGENGKKKNSTYSSSFTKKNFPNTFDIKKQFTLKLSVNPTVIDTKLNR